MSSPTPNGPGPTMVPADPGAVIRGLQSRYAEEVTKAVAWESAYQGVVATLNAEREQHEVVVTQLQAELARLRATAALSDEVLAASAPAEPDLPRSKPRG